MSQTIDASQAGLGAEDLSALREALRGRVLEPAEAGYEDARRIYNGAITRQPAALAQVSGPADVAAVLGFAADRGLSVSVRGGGHSASGHALGGDVVIDLSTLRGVSVDPQQRIAVVAGGCTWADVDVATQAHGLAVPGGRISHTGVGGLTLGGGEGWLSAKHGMTSDNLVSVELVTADGRIVVASDENEPELFWALRGGGGNFGVATSFTFRLHPLPPFVLGGLMLYRLTDAHDVFAVLDELREIGRDEWAPAAIFLNAPPAPFVPGDLVGRPVLAVAPAWMGNPEEGLEFIKPLRERLHPLVDAAGPMPYVALQSMVDEGNPPGRRQRWSGGYLPTLPPALIDALVDAATTTPSPFSQITVNAIGPAVARLDDNATAFPCRRATWLVHPMTGWIDEADDEANVSWVQGISALLREHGETTSYLNLDDTSNERVAWAFGDERYARLQQVKATWDPTDVFRHCAHVTPSAPGSPS